MTPDEEFEPGVGCRTPVTVLGFFLVLALLGGVAFFTGDPEAISFWRRWALGATLPVSGLLVGFGAAGLAWSLDLVVLVGASAWAARPEAYGLVRRRVVIIVAVFVALGFVSASIA